MASIFEETRGGRTLYRVQYADKRGRRRKLRLGGLTKRDAQKVAAMIDSIVSCQVSGNCLPVSVSTWLDSIGDKLHSQLAEQGLCRSRKLEDLEGFLSGFMKSHQRNVGFYGERNLALTQQLLIERFAASKPLRDITAKDADEFRQWLKIEKVLAEATIAGHIKRAKQFFRAAVGQGAISISPFSGVVAGSQANAERSVYVDVHQVRTAIDAAPDSQWRLIIALCRFAGLRCPSEVLGLRWSDVDFVGNLLSISCTKTKKQGKSKRTMPILPELRPYLEDAFDPESERVISKYCTTNTNLRKMFLEILKRAGLEPWPRLFHNLRGSLETDLFEHHAAHVVVNWLGNSPQTALTHYLKVRPTDIAKAVELGVGAKVGQNLSEGREQRGKQENREPPKSGIIEIPGENVGYLIRPAGLEPATLSSED